MTKDIISFLCLNEKKRQFWNFELVFPKQIDLEVTNACNLRCTICPQPTQKRECKHMKFEIARKAIDEINKYGLPRMCLSDWGEPFLNEEFFEISRYAAKSGQIKFLFISTNGLLLDSRISEELLTSGLDRIIISLDGACKETYEKIRVGSNYEKVIANIMDYIKIRNLDGKLKPAVAVQLIRFKETEREISDFIHFWQSRIGPQDQIDIKEYISWQHQFPYHNYYHHSKFEIRVPCLTYLWTHLVIHSNGDICACCYDLNGDLLLGNIKDDSIYDVWHGEKHRRLCRMHLEGLFKNIPVCANCKLTRRQLSLQDLFTALRQRLIIKNKTLVDGTCPDE